MLDGVSREVDLQRGRVRVGPVAVGALVGFVLVVLSLVRLETAGGEGGGGHGTRPAPAPPPHAPAPRPPRPDLEVGELGEGLFAAGVRALVGSVAGVDSGEGAGGDVRVAPPSPPPRGSHAGWGQRRPRQGGCHNGDRAPGGGGGGAEATRVLRRGLEAMSEAGRMMRVVEVKSLGG